MFRRGARQSSGWEKFPCRRRSFGPSNGNDRRKSCIKLTLQKQIQHTSQPGKGCLLASRWGTRLGNSSMPTKLSSWRRAGRIVIRPFCWRRAPWISPPFDGLRTGGNSLATNARLKNDRGTNSLESNSSATGADSLLEQLQFLGMGWW